MNSKDVYQNIEDSIFFTQKGKMIFYFSSEFNRRRFEKSYKEYIREQTARIKNKYHVNIKLDEYLLIALYKKIEKRGFRIFKKSSEELEKISEYDIFEIRK